MRREDRQALSLSGLGLAATAAALGVQQLWPHAPWYVWYGILWFGIITFALSAASLLYLHFSWRKLGYGAMTVVIVISGGAIWYYKSLPEKTPLSLLEVYVTDTFPSTLPIREDLLIDSKLSPLHLTILVTKYYEFTANSYYYSMYIPRSQYTYDLCTDLATNFSKRVSERFSWLQTSSRIPGDSSTMEESEMVFTGRVYLYTQDDLPPDKIGELYKVYKQHNFYLQYKGMEYLSHHLWEFERRNSDLKQFKEQPNHQNL